MVDGQNESNAGSFLVEVCDRDVTDVRVRVAVLAGAATVANGDETRTLTSGQQVQVDRNGAISQYQSPNRELLANGNFSNGLNGWVDYRNESPVNSDTSDSASIELIDATTTSGPTVAVEFLRAGPNVARAETGIRQRIGQTLRNHSSLVLNFEVMISAQLPAGGGDALDAFPLSIALNYLDGQGNEQTWRHAYYVLDDPTRSVPDELATQIDLGVWQHIAFDLHNLNPAPQQITSIVVYASGQRYETRVANLSLSTSESVAPAE
jgi:hypothetical protein